MSELRKHVSPALVVSMVAVVIALTGTAVAGLPGSNSVGKDDIAKGVVGGRDLKAPVIDTQVVTTQAGAEAQGAYGERAVCRENTRVVNGGFNITPKSDETTMGAEIAASYQEGNGWTVLWEKTNDAEATYTVQAYCVPLGD